MQLPQSQSTSRKRRTPREDMPGTDTSSIRQRNSVLPMFGVLLGCLINLHMYYFSCCTTGVVQGYTLQALEGIWAKNKCVANCVNLPPSPLSASGLPGAPILLLRAKHTRMVPSYKRPCRRMGMELQQRSSATKAPPFTRCAPGVYTYTGM